MKKALVALLSLLLALGSTAAPALAYANTANWAGNGSSVNNGVFNVDTSTCTGGEYNGVYLLWVLTAKNATHANIDFDGAGGAAPAAMTKMGGGSFHYVQTFPNGFVAPMVGLVSATYDGVYKKATLTLSHGCLPSDSMNVVKTITGDAPHKVGDIVSYQIAVTNNGNTVLHNVTLTDQWADIDLSSCTMTLPVAALAIGASFTCNATHAVTQEEYDARQVINTAVAHSDETDKNSNTTVDPIFVPVPSLSVLKSLTSSPVVKVGDVATYSILVTNTGNIPLTNVNVTDDNATITGCTPSIPVLSLAIGATISCTATRTVTDADFNAGKLDNVAKATSDQVNGESNLIHEPLTPAPALSIHKDSLNPASAIGDVINYKITVQNTGNVTATNVNIVDENANAVLGTCTVGLTTVTLPLDLAVGTEVDCSYSITVTEADMLAQVVVNKAHTTSSNASQANSNEVTNPLTDAPSLNVVKAFTGANPAKTGDLIHYTVTVSNNGNVPVHNVSLTDVGSDIGTCTVSLPVATLGLGESFSCDVTHTVTDADMAALSYTNTATAHSDEIQNKDSNDVLTPLTPTPSMSVVKSITNAAPQNEGDTILYSIVVTNTGNVTLTNVAVTDANADIIGCAVNSDSATAGPWTLAIGDVLTCTASHVTTNADWTSPSGKYVNTASVTSNQKNQNSNTVETPLVATPAISIVKSIVAGPTPLHAGDLINYHFVITNTGNVTLHNVVLTDNFAIIDSYSVTGPISLAPGEFVTVEAHHVTTNDDFVAGHYDNLGSVKSDETPTPKNSNTVETLLTKNAVLELTKIQTSADPVHVGDVITYLIRAHNAGNIILHNVVVTDPKGSNLVCDPSGAVDLPVNGYITCTASHTASSADFSAGKYTNTAFATSTEVDAPPSTVETPLTATPALVVTKALDGPIPTKPGDVIHYIIVVGNTGNVDLVGVQLTDPNAVLSDCTSAFDLAYGAQITCHASHTTTLADFNTGFYDNIARAKVGDTQGTSNLVHVPLVPGAAISVTKIINNLPPTKVGDVAQYTIVVANTGNVPLTNVNVTDPVAHINSCTPVRPATLAVGAKMTCIATHMATDADFAAGKIDNIASASSNEASANSNLVHLPLTRAANMTITKVVYGTAPARIGDVINYHVVFTNTGNVNLHNVLVTDANGAFVSCTDNTAVLTTHTVTVATLHLGDVVSCRVTHTVTQRDANAGRVINVAVATAQENVTATSGSTSNGLNSNEVVTKLRYNGGNALTVINGTGFVGGTLAFTGGEENLANDGTVFYGLLIVGAVGLVIRRRVAKLTR